MRNIFDQYSQPENRVTHALMTAINEDRALLRSFLRDLVKVRPPTSVNDLQIREQQFPWAPTAREEKPESEGVPDGWIFDANGWCVLIESKVLITLKAGQINAHRYTAKRRGFREVIAVAFVPIKLDSYPGDIITIQWREVYSWLCRHRRESEWAARAADFLEVTESKLIGTTQLREGTLTRFTGIPFSHENPYAYLEAKRVLGLALEDLRSRSDLKRKLGMNLEVHGRGAITGTCSNAVWDLLSLSNAADAKNFTKYPHLTLGITSVATEVMVTAPNAISGTIRRKLKELGDEGFRDVVGLVVENMRPLLRKHPGAAPWFRGVQRRYCHCGIRSCLILNVLKYALENCWTSTTSLSSRLASSAERCAMARPRRSN